jgi:ankyrin repeat protein
LEAAKWLLARGARVNSELMRWSPLYHAVFAGHWEVANHLLLKGADINARIANGSSVLMMAVYEGHEPLVRRLLARRRSRHQERQGDGAPNGRSFQRLGIARLRPIRPTASPRTGPGRAGVRLNARSRRPRRHPKSLRRLGNPRRGAKSPARSTNWSACATPWPHAA